jgi:ketosteroid isomerase-like protein
MSPRLFPTAQDAENAFYEALERADLEAMMAVWAEDEDIVCVHPAGTRLAGHDQVRESWRQIFASGQRLRVELTQQLTVAGMMFAVHSVNENFLVDDETRRRPPIVATNVYVRGPAGWKMVAHHASPAPAESKPPAAREAAPKILH